MKNKKQKPKYRIYQETWKRLIAELIPIFKSWGFKKIHYDGWIGWSAENQSYEYDMIIQDISNGILSINIWLYPRWSILRITIKKYPNNKSFKIFDEYEYSPTEWSEHMYYEGFTEYQLLNYPQSSFINCSDFKIKFNPNNPENNNLDVLFQRLHVNLPSLKNAAFNSSDSNLVQIKTQPPRHKLSETEMNQNFNKWKKAEKENELRKQKYYYYGLGIFMFIILGLIIHENIFG